MSASLLKNNYEIIYAALTSTKHALQRLFIRTIQSSEATLPSTQTLKVSTLLRYALEYLVRPLGSGSYPTQLLDGLLDRLHDFGQTRIHGRFGKGQILPGITPLALFNLMRRLAQRNA